MEWIMQYNSIIRGVLLEMLSNLAWKFKSGKLEREGFLYRIYTNGSHLLD